MCVCVIVLIRALLVRSRESHKRVVPVYRFSFCFGVWFAVGVCGFVSGLLTVAIALALTDSVLQRFKRA